MTGYLPRDVSPRGPVYRAIADALARDIEAGQLTPGERLPTHRELARELGLNVMTVTRAYAEAARRGLVEAEVGRGTFVKSGRVGEAPFLPLVDPRRTDVVDFHFHLPATPPDLLGLETLFTELARNPHEARLLDGYFPSGHPSHRAAGARWMQRSGVATDSERTFVCNGAQQALSVALTALVEPGEVLLTEELTYSGMKSLAKVLRLRIQPLPVDDDGILPEAFEEACRKGKPRALYTMPNLQNPTCTVLPVERRRALAATAERYGVTIIEDDTTGFILADPPPAIASFAPQRVVFVTSLSKSLCGGLRIGYLLAPADDPALTERFSTHLAALSWMGSPLTAELATRWIEDGTAERVVAWKRAESLWRRRRFDELLGQPRTISHPCSGTVWLPLPAPWRCQDFVAAASQRGLAVTPSEVFVVGRAPAPHTVRVSLATPLERAAVERGSRTLAELFASTPQAGASIC